MHQPFHALFVAMLVGVIVMRLGFHRSAGVWRDKAAMRAGLAREGVFRTLRIWLGIPFGIALLGYAVWPPLLSFASVPIAPAFRWAGVVVAMLGIVLLAWVHFALGRHFSTTLSLRDDHALVTSGPYHWVRHPMYTSFLLMYAGWFLMSANLLLGISAGAMLWALIQFRTPLEEAQLEERFGDAYRLWAARTGRLLPRLG